MGPVVAAVVVALLLVFSNPSFTSFSILSLAFFREKNDLRVNVQNLQHRLQTVSLWDRTWYRQGGVGGGRIFIRTIVCNMFLNKVP